jgi:hypothetical protein
VRGCDVVRVRRTGRQGRQPSNVGILQSRRHDSGPKRARIIDRAEEIQIGVVARWSPNLDATVNVSVSKQRK